MGNTFSNFFELSEESRDIRIANGSIFQSDIQQVLDKQLIHCNSFDLQCLCKHYHFDDPKVKKALINRKDFVGSDFLKLVELTQETDITKEKERLVHVVSKYMNNDIGMAKLFIDNVILKKIQEERRPEWTSKLVLRTDFQCHFPTTTSTTTTASSKNMTDDQMNQHQLPIIRPIEMHKLTPNERNRIEFVKKKLSEENRSEEITTAQKLVCEDMFLMDTFIVPIRNPTNYRVVDSEAFLNVKLLISDMGLNTFKKKIASLTSISEFGIVHTGLLIGEWKIDWFNNSLVSVKCDCEKKLSASSTIAALDIGMIVGADKVKDTLKQISKIACLYNGENTYSIRYKNCQHFVSDILEALGLKHPLKLNECFARYFEELKKGNVDRTFRFSQTLIHLIKNSKLENPYSGLKECTFTSRKQLDSFCHFLSNIDYFETKEGSIDRLLLKAFDRSFVLIGQNATLVSQDSFGTIKDYGFFTKNGGRDEDSITRIEYSVKGVDFSDCTLRL